MKPQYPVITSEVIGLAMRKKRHYVGMLAVLFAIAAQGAIVRDVVPESPSRVSVVIDWSFDADMPSGLILEEVFPAGWVLDASGLEGADHWRVKGNRLAMVMGLETGVASEGSVRYAIVPDEVPPGGSLSFEGRGYAIVESQWVTCWIQGISQHTFPGVAPPVLPFWISNVRESDTETGKYLDLIVSKEPPSAEDVFQVATSNTDIFSELSVVVEHRTLTQDGQWQGIYTSRPPERLSFPDVIRMPFLPPSGMLRLRVLDEPEAIETEEEP